MTYNLPKEVILPIGMPNYEKLNKAKNIYARMAIVFDYEFYEDDRNDTKLYQYLYFIFYMLACKKMYFPNKFDDYDGYALYASREIYMRAIKFQKKGVRIKSILNYAKAVLYSMKVNYQNETFRTVINPKVVPFDSDSYHDRLKANIQADYDKGKSEEVIAALGMVPNAIRAAVDGTPYAADALMRDRLYKSCLVTYINWVTLPNKYAEKAKSMDDQKTIKLLNKEAACAPILIGLDADMSDYVSLLCRKAKSSVVKAITETSSGFDLDDSYVDAIIQDLFSTGNVDDHNGEMEE